VAVINHDNGTSYNTTQRAPANKNAQEIQRLFTQVAADDAQLEVWKQRMDSMEREMEKLKAKVGQLNKEINAGKAGRRMSTQAINRNIDAHNSAVKRFNALFNDYEDLRKRHNLLVVKRNEKYQRMKLLEQ
jgi:phage shock protein A